ncbi:clarin-3 [Menidia menidia]|uniref:(Atlantic silverside) hypothetical protein n=1 Tax=Menidia menidia TaxID=238744 RepID=A0A8S4ATM4_9TELE|nr:unnamed protein product [Menidia menidia]
MPSTTKIIHFLSSALVTAVSVGLLGFAMSTQWARINIRCAMAESSSFNGSAEIFLGLFDGIIIRSSCPSFGTEDEFKVISTIKNTGTTPLALHVLVVCLLALSLLFSAVSILVSLYNSVSNPYETYMGPVGVYTCSSLSACLSLVALIIFVVYVNVTNMAKDLVTIFVGALPVDLGEQSAEMRVGYYLVIPYIVFSLGAVALIYMYQHVAYEHKRQQERPTEDAPKEIMMY